MALDGLRPPSALDAQAGLYKDWLHLNLFDQRSGLVGLVNVAAHGAPHDPRARAVGAALVHVPGYGWAGNLEAIALAAAAFDHRGIGLRGVALGLGADDVLASARLEQDGLELAVTARATSPPLTVPLRLPLGDGWISWSAVSHLAAAGSATVGGSTIPLDRCDAYHDHNWGRWRWGDDIGWRWGCFLAPGGDPAIIIGRTYDRAHRNGHRPVLVVHSAGRRRVFTGSTVRIDTAGTLAARPRRLPGALAALHSDRARPALPAEVHVGVDDARGRVRLRFKAAAAAQLITAEPGERGYGFIHELPGAFEASGAIDGAAFEAEGPGIYEHVD
jgi:hypothetical protein